MTEQKVAVVTGASSGIGEAPARMLAGQGFRVVCAARRSERVEALAAELGGVAVTCDVTDVSSVAALADAVGGRCQVLVNNAGGAYGLDPVETADEDDWRTMWEVNVLGTLHVTKALLPALEATGEGIIVNVGSIAGRAAYEGGAGYTGAKHALAVMDVDPGSSTCQQVVGRVELSVGDEVHHFGWNACSAALCPYAPHPHLERRDQRVPGR